MRGGRSGNLGKLSDDTLAAMQQLWCTVSQDGAARKRHHKLAVECSGVGLLGLLFLADGGSVRA